MPKTKPQPRRLDSTRWKWRPDNVWKGYAYARDGQSDNAIAKLLGADVASYWRWRERHPEFGNAIKEGRRLASGKTQGGTQSFHQYVYQHLSDELRKIWDEIHGWEKEQNGIKRIEAIFAVRGKRARQHLFLYALTASNFNASKAIRKVGINQSTLQSWITTDPEFAGLLDEIHWHKGNFFESALIREVKNGDINAILFANRTFNQNRGYGAKLEIEHSGTIEHNHSIDIDSLNLSLDVRRAILKAAQEAGKLDVIDSIAAEAPRLEK